MKTVVLGDPPAALVSLIAERQRLGLDGYDEIWQGEYHMAPMASVEHATACLRIGRLLSERAEEFGLTGSTAFNLGAAHDFRVPDVGVHRGEPRGVWVATAVVVVEVRSRDDETYEKFGFYFERGVEELLVADLETRRVQWWVRGAAAFEPAAASAVLGVGVADIVQALRW